MGARNVPPAAMFWDFRGKRHRRTPWPVWAMFLQILCLPGRAWNRVVLWSCQYCVCCCCILPFMVIPLVIGSLLLGPMYLASETWIDISVNQPKHVRNIEQMIDWVIVPTNAITQDFINVVYRGVSPVFTAHNAVMEGWVNSIEAFAFVFTFKFNVAEMGESDWLAWTEKVLDIIEFFADVFNKLFETMAGWGNTAFTAVKNAWNTMVEFLKDFFIELGVIFTAFGHDVKNAFHWLFFTLWELMQDAVEYIVAFFEYLGVTSVSTAQTIGTALSTLVTSLEPIALQIRDFFDDVVSVVAAGTWQVLNDIATCFASFTSCICDAISLPC